MAREYKRISGDSHLEVPNERWTHRVDAKYRDDAPKTVTGDDGADTTVVAGLPARSNPMDLYGGSGRGDWVPFGRRYADTPGTGSPEQRLSEQDQDKLDAEVLFPAVVCGPRLWLGIEDHGLQKAIFRGWNDWLAEEYCSAAPDRLWGVGAIPGTGLDDAVEEIERCKRQGLRAVQLSAFPSGGGRPLPEDDRFWAASVDLDMPVTIHVEIDRSGPRGGKLLDYPQEPPELARSTELAFQVQRFATRGGGTNAVQLVLSGLFERFPSLTIDLAETSIGWVPFFLEIADVRYERHIHWAQRLNGFKPLPALPSEIINEHFYWGFQQDRSGVELRHRMNVERLIWAADFPHQESDWPDSDGVFAHNFGGVPDDEVYKMTVGNALRFFRIDGS
ncbi:MAG: amidohydrolase [Chloroflexi bacterium]|nr:amidohydrolase [Chloroflexota bacterium]